jgi:antitoxin YefM
MSRLDYEDVKEKLADLWDEAVSTRQPIVIRRPGKEDIAIIAADELSAYMETAHLLSAPKNARRLLGAIERSQRGEGVRMTMEEIKGKFPLDGAGS